MSEGKLFVCPTPIGNLGDVTIRVLDTLRGVDIICAEDTRVTSRLLAAYNIDKPIERLDEAMLSKHLDRVVERLVSGEKLAYCSDAGMPGVSDPGLRLVNAARKAGVPVEVLPGASAAVTAYVASGSTDLCFYFGGFLPRRSAEATTVLSKLRTLEAALVFYESPARLVASLQTIAAVFPLRQVCVCRELTKFHEEVQRASSGELHRLFEERARTTGIKGEIVIVIEGASDEERLAEEVESEEAARRRAGELKASGGYSNKDISRLLQQEFNIPRNLAYDIVVSA